MRSVVHQFFRDHWEATLAVTLILVGVAAIGILLFTRTFRASQITKIRVVVNQYAICFLLGFMTIVPAALMTAAGADVAYGSEKDIGVGLFIGGLILLVIAVAVGGHSSYELDVEQGVVMVVSRWCLCFPYTRRWEVEDVRGFTLRLSFNNQDPVYQLLMTLMNGDTVALERTATAKELRKRQTLCTRLNDLLMQSRQRHNGGYGTFRGGGDGDASSDASSRSSRDDDASSYSSYASYTTNGTMDRSLLSEMSGRGGAGMGLGHMIDDSASQYSHGSSRRGLAGLRSNSLVIND